LNDEECSWAKFQQKSLVGGAMQKGKTESENDSSGCDCETASNTSKSSAYSGSTPVLSEKKVFEEIRKTVEKQYPGLKVFSAAEFRNISHLVHVSRRWARASNSDYNPELITQYRVKDKGIPYYDNLLALKSLINGLRSYYLIDDAPEIFLNGNSTKGIERAIVAAVFSKMSESKFFKQELKGRGWTINNEYNRQGKEGEAKVSDGKRVTPDIVIHKPGKSGPEYNLLAVEFKTEESERAVIDDRRKLEGLIRTHGYQFGVSVTLKKTLMETFDSVDIITGQGKAAQKAFLYHKLADRVEDMWRRCILGRD